MYLIAIIDVYSRKIIGWVISNNMSKQWVLSVLKDAIAQHGKPEIINSDQGFQYTNLARMTLKNKGYKYQWIAREER